VRAQKETVKRACLARDQDGGSGPWESLISSREGCREKQKTNLNKRVAGARSNERRAYHDPGRSESRTSSPRSRSGFSTVHKAQRPEVAVPSLGDPRSRRRIMSKESPAWMGHKIQVGKTGNQQGNHAKYKKNIRSTPLSITLSLVAERTSACIWPTRN